MAAKLILLHDTTIPGLAAGEYRDKKADGLHLRVGANKRTWFVRHRVDGKQERSIIGHYPKDKLAAMRQECFALQERAQAGVPLKAAPVRQVGKTVGQIIDLYEAHQRRVGVRIRSLDDSMKTVRRELEAFLNTSACRFTKADLHGVFKAIRDSRGKVSAANAFLRYFSPIWGWASQEPDLENDVPTNFARDIKKSKQEARKRTLDDRELAAVWWACDLLEGQAATLGSKRAARSYANIIRVLILTGQRLEEVSTLTHGRIFDGVWVKKPEDNKSDRDHEIRLPKVVLDLIGEGAVDALVFPGHRHGRPVSGFSKLKAELDRLSGVGGSKVKGDVTHWQTHDLRRTMSRGMKKKLGIHGEVIHGITNHSEQGLDKVYMPDSNPTELMAVALRRWADYVLTMVEKYKPAEQFAQAA